MIEIEEMNALDCTKLLARIGYGHLGLVRERHPYVVPIHYACDAPNIYIYTTEGKKTDIIELNPEVCLQVEEVIDEKHWQSVTAAGTAVKLTEEVESEQAMKFILAGNPQLTPALSIRWMDAWVRSNCQVVYRMTPKRITGRTTVDRSKR